ncbi:hypothetical protein J4406_01605 [Candidatus Woesearchaeota archaeon]|nr:hypothetical protein [Candidatus Woesearchaeota archaeon]
MDSWTGWIAALGGLVAILDMWFAHPYFLWIGGLAAIIFGVWGATAK